MRAEDNPLRALAESRCGPVRVDRGKALYRARGHFADWEYFTAEICGQFSLLTPRDGALRAFAQWAAAGQGRAPIPALSPPGERGALDEERALFIQIVKRYELGGAPGGWRALDMRLRALAARALREGQGGALLRDMARVLDAIKRTEVLNMKITYLGHSCFLIENAEGRTLLTDPFDESVGYALPTVAPDAVTVSHEHYDHNCVRAAGGNPQVIRGEGRAQAFGFTLTGIASFHDEANGSKRGPNTIFVIEADGLRVAHMGDLGHMLSQEQIARLGRVDILLLPVGGTYTIDGPTAHELMRRVKPRVTIPMHYRTADSTLPITDEKPFTALSGGTPLGCNVLNVSAEDISTLPGVLLMDYRA